MVTTEMKPQRCLLEAMNTTISSESLASLYYPLYGGITGDNDEEEEGKKRRRQPQNAFVVHLGYTGAKYPTKQYCRSLSGICYMTKVCILLDIIKRARTRRVSLRVGVDIHSAFYIARLSHGYS